METITRSNYETYMVDHWDGNLTPDQEDMLLDFLKRNPDIREELLEAGHYTLPEETLSFDAKKSLLKDEVGHQNIDEFLVGELEHQLLPHEQNELHIFIAGNPQYQRDRALYAQTKLNPAERLIYPGKRGLKKGTVQPLWVSYGRVAAAACLFLVFGTLWFNGRNEGIALQNERNNVSPILLPGSDLELTHAVSEKQASYKQAPQVNRQHNNAPVPVFVSEKKKGRKNIIPIPVKNAVTENFYSYSKNRHPEDYLGGLINTYLPPQTNLIPRSPEEVPEESEPVAKNTDGNVVNNIATKGLMKMFKDSALGKEIENKKYSVKTKVAKALAWATANVSGGKVKAEAIPNLDGSLGALSFTNGKYNYTKKF